MIIDRKRAKTAFEAYVKRYDMAAPMIRLKAEHTYRVSELCEELALSAGLTGDDVDLAWLTGLLHDIGRFEQQKRYGTFHDAVSIDHARYGAGILFPERGTGEEISADISEGSISIRDFIADERYDQLIWTTVYYHSAYRLPEDLDERTGMFCNIIRDADKIDILRVNVEFPLEEIYHVDTETLYGETVTEGVMESFFRGTAVLRSLKKTSVDHIVGHISLFFELVYPRSREIVRSQGYLEKMMHFQSENPVTREQFQRIREKMYGELNFS